MLGKKDKLFTPVRMPDITITRLNELLQKHKENVEK
jgi:hypothetical protein